MLFHGCGIRQICKSPYVTSCGAVGYVEKIGKFAGHLSFPRNITTQLEAE